MCLLFKIRKSYISLHPTTVYMDFTNLGIYCKIEKINVVGGGAVLRLSTGKLVYVEAVADTVQSFIKTEAQDKIIESWYNRRLL